MLLHERLAAFEFSSVPTWVFDADFFRQRWANRAALELWRANTPEDLYARDYSDMSESTRARMQGYVAGFREGRNAQEQWTLYPKGDPVTMKLFLSGVPLDDGRTGVLIQAFEITQGPSADLVRSIEALRHTTLMISIIDIQGEIILQNPADTRTFGGAKSFKDRFLDEFVADALLESARAGEVFGIETELKTEQGMRWHSLEARTLTDPATGATVVLVQQTDETLRRQAEQRADSEASLATELRGTLAVVERQKEEIIALSAPMLEVSESTIAVPIIGMLDSSRTSALETRILARVAERGATSVILDLTGVDAVSSGQTTTQVARLARAMRLLGAQTIVTGVTSVLAREMVVAEVDMGNVLMLRSLRDGIAAARKRAR
ncbi:MAG TPA: PAS domain-containing protein [Polyangium sp.]|nr:PAS domain-containing protein [Polyangium sp.]